MSYLETLTKDLREGGIELPQYEARQIIAHVLNISPESFLLSPPVANDYQIQTMRNMVAERLQHRPLCKILGTKGFYKYDFFVNENVLSPRPDTEILVETAIAAGQHLPSGKILDLGTGSGCILLSILKDLPQLEGWAVDASASALEVAEKNALSLHVDSRVQFFNYSWFDSTLLELLPHDFDIIVSNPPYIPHCEIEDLDLEVKNYDPLSALDGGIDGLFHYRRIAEISAEIIKPEGMIFLEGGLHQEEDIASIFTDQGFVLQKIIPDLAGINRCIFLKK